MGINRISTRISTKTTALYLLLLTGVLVLMAAIDRCQAPSVLAPVQKGHSGGDTIDAAVVYGPLSYCLRGDTLAGFNYEMLLAMQQGLGRPVRMHPVSSRGDALARLKAGQYDLLASLPADNELKSEWLTTEPVYLDRMVLVQLTDSLHTPVTSALDLAGDTIHVEAGSSAVLRLRHLSTEIGAQVYIAEEPGLSEEYLAMKVGSGEWRYAVIRHQTARRMAAGYPGLHYETPISFTQFQVWVLRPDDTALKSTLDTWLRQFATTDSARVLNERYLAE